MIELVLFIGGVLLLSVLGGIYDKLRDIGYHIETIAKNSRPRIKP